MDLSARILKNPPFRLATLIVSLLLYFSPLPSQAATVLYSDDFELSMGNWSNVQNIDNKDWTRDAAGTPSYNTGPSTGSAGSNYYIYLETSGGSAYSAGDSAILIGPPIYGEGIQLSFDYHMFGSNMGTLAVDVLSSGVWINDVWIISGQQHASSQAAYLTTTVDLSGYTVSQIRFRATAAGGFMGDMAIDNVTISSFSQGPVAPAFTSDPFSKTDAVTNLMYTDSLADDAMDGNGDTLYFSKVNGPAWLSISTDGSLSGTPLDSDIGVNSFLVNVSDGVLSSSATLEIQVVDNNAPQVLSFTDFENGLGDWVNVISNDNKDWTLDSYGTPSSGTGPSTGANGSASYVYLETSYGGAITGGDSAILEGPAIDGWATQLEFQYHMYGAHMGTLAVDVFAAGYWVNNVWQVSGQQHPSNNSPYSTAVVDLNYFAPTKIRFRATAAGGYMGDMAIDNIKIIGINAALIDTDNDGVPDNIDLCPFTPANEVANSDGCSPSQIDSDGDGVPDPLDMCPATPVGEVANTDGCSPSQLDTDNDGVDDSADLCPATPANELVDGNGCSPSQLDSDNDGVADSVDLCPNTVPGQAVNADGCSPSQIDTDGDGYHDAIDAFPLDKNEWLDTDGDNIGNNADQDDDNDGVIDVEDAFPLDASESVDTDSDGVGNNADTDDDGDGIPDLLDAYPLASIIGFLDTDGDGAPDDCNAMCVSLGMGADTDDDNDGVADVDDAFPQDSSETIDTDNDGIGNNADTDDDGDGVPDVNDVFPLDASESQDTDGDGIGNNADIDDDNDGIIDLNDAFPLDSTESIDTDGDGVGNNADTDDDNDGIPDVYENLFVGMAPLVDDANSDLDSDGVSNIDEYLAGTNPSNQKLDAYSVNQLGYIYRIDLYTGTTYPIGAIPVSGFFTPSGLAISPLGLLFVVDSYSDMLYSVDIFTGKSNQIGSLNINANNVGLSFDGSGTLWMVSDDTNLYTIDPASGNATIHGSTGLASLDSLAWDGTNMYGIASSGVNATYLIDRSTATATFVGNLVNVDITRQSGLSYQATGTLWGVESYGKVFTVDSTTGEAWTYTTISETFSGLAILYDTDGDGLPDGWEILYGMDPLDPSDALLNYDDDLLINIEEFTKGTNPLIADTDGDGVNDDADDLPTDNSEWTDTDGDGIGNNADLDDDNDGFNDVSDPYPLDETKPQWIKVTHHDLAGDNAGLLYAISVAGIGDINSDGYDDFIVGRKNQHVKVYSGYDASIIHTLTGPAYSNFGNEVISIGDISGDGVNDFAVSAPITGQVFVYSGSTMSEIYAWSGVTSYGSSIAAAGDVNNDGTPDVVIGAPDDDINGTLSRAGSVEIRSGLDGIVIHKLEGSNANARFGSATTGMGDVNGDGYADFALKAYSSSYNNRSIINIYSGRTGTRYSAVDGYYGRTFGYRLANMGDIDGDGKNDLGATNPDATNSSGVVAIISAQTGQWISSKAGTSYSKAGYNLVSVGDFNKDGINDYLMSLHADAQGKAWLVSGADNEIIFEFLPQLVDDDYGYGLDYTGDVNGDGLDDFIIGASANGRVEIVSVMLDSDSDGTADLYDAFPLDDTAF